mgnify:CR=1 FL=1
MNDAQPFAYTSEGPSCPTVGIGEITFQPSEIGKLGLIMTTAFVLSVFRDKNGLSSFGFKLAAINIGCTLLLIITENLSTAAIIFVVMYLVCFYAQVSSKLLLWLGGSLLGMALAGYLTAVNIPQSTLDEWAKSDGIMHRVPTWVNRVKNKNELPSDPTKYDITKNVQVTHAQIAIATCGITGRGPGNSIERDFLPQAFSDFIYAIILEELGWHSILTFDEYGGITELADAGPIGNLAKYLVQRSKVLPAETSYQAG